MIIHAVLLQKDQIHQHLDTNTVNRLERKLLCVSCLSSLMNEEEFVNWMRVGISDDKVSPYLEYLSFLNLNKVEEGVELVEGN